MHADVEVVLPVHPNPCVKKVVTQELGQYARIHLIEPLGYSEFLWVLSKSCIVLTDSGGVQEEAPSFSKPVLVLREVTERMEGVDAGVARLVGTNVAAIIEEASKLLTDADEYRNIAKIDNPYGDGQSRARFVEMLKNL
jgi:UDP-N-acetylglucosamine 2-epimerase (non-hydrolysing)